MAAYVVTPSGEILEYPTANYATRNHDGKTELYTNTKKEAWVADIPSGFAVGWGRPRALGQSTDARQLKRALRNFDSRTGRWKD